MLSLELLSYEQWDAIADIYIPCLFFFSVVTLIYQHKRGLWPKTCYHLGIFLIGVFNVYCLKFIDKQLAIWPALNSDYSTHTALSLWFAIFLFWRMPILRLRILLLLSWLLYLSLMRYQGYHSVFDMVSTTLVILPVSVGILVLGTRCRRTKNLC